jgi:hypothetical protein
MPRELEDSLVRTFNKRKRKGELKGVEKGQYVFGSKVMRKAISKKKHEGAESKMFERGE